MLGALTIPVAIAMFTAFPEFIEKSEGGPALAGALVGVGAAVAGVFFGAAKMLNTIPAILKARNGNPVLRKLSEDGSITVNRPDTKTSA